MTIMCPLCHLSHLLATASTKVIDNRSQGPMSPSIPTPTHQIGLTHCGSPAILGWEGVTQGAPLMTSDLITAPTDLLNQQDHIIAS